MICIIKKKKIKKQKIKVENDIKQLEKLNLCLGNYSNYYKQKIYINGKECYLVYKKLEGQENNYIGNRNLATQDYSIFYEILNKYDLIKYEK